MEVKEYIDLNEVNHFADFVNSVKDKTLKRKIKTKIIYLGLGNFSSHRNLTKGIGEIKISYGQGTRIYFGRDGDSLVLLLLGNYKGKKKEQNKDIEKAQDLWQEYLSRKGNKDE